MEKSKLTTFGERLRSGGASMTRTLTQKMKEMKDLLQSPTPESRLVDQATSPTLESPDWGLNLRICSLITSQDISGVEVVRCIKKKVLFGGDAKTQRLGLELLEASAMNCEKVLSEIASEKVVEEIVEKVVRNPRADRECQVRAMELIRAWGESSELDYLPVFRNTYETLKNRGTSSHVEDGTFPPMQYSLESYMDQDLTSPPENYPVPGPEANSASGTSLPYDYASFSTEQKKEFLELTRNSLEVLSSLLSSTNESNVPEDDLTINMLDKCKESQPVLQRIVQSTTDDESLLFEALNLNDELQRIISKFDKLQVSVKPDDMPKESSSTDANSTNPEKESSSVDANPPLLAEAVKSDKSPESPKANESVDSSSDKK